MPLAVPSTRLPNPTTLPVTAAVVTTVTEEIEPDLEHETPTIMCSKSIAVEIALRKTLNINPNLSPAEKQRRVTLLQEHSQAFAWDYMDMKGISSDLCTHDIYIKAERRPISHPKDE